MSIELRNVLTVFFPHFECNKYKIASLWMFSPTPVASSLWSAIGHVSSFWLSFEFTWSQTFYSSWCCSIMEKYGVLEKKNKTGTISMKCPVLVKICLFVSYLWNWVMWCHCSVCPALKWINFGNLMSFILSSSLTSIPLVQSLEVPVPHFGFLVASLHQGVGLNLPNFGWHLDSGQWENK